MVHSIDKALSFFMKSSQARCFYLNGLRPITTDLPGTSTRHIRRIVSVSYTLTDIFVNDSTQAALGFDCSS
jgi:hypothetical protein